MKRTGHSIAGLEDPCIVGGAGDAGQARAVADEAHGLHGAGHAHGAHDEAGRIAPELGHLRIKRAGGDDVQRGLGNSRGNTDGRIVQPAEKQPADIELVLGVGSGRTLEIADDDIVAASDVLIPRIGSQESIAGPQVGETAGIADHRIIQAGAVHFSGSRTHKDVIGIHVNLPRHGAYGYAAIAGQQRHHRAAADLVISGVDAVAAEAGRAGGIVDGAGADSDAGVSVGPGVRTESGRGSRRLRVGAERAGVVLVIG